MTPGPPTHDRRGPRMRVGDPDGYGFKGVLTETPLGELLCHDCGWTGNHLGLHAWKAHGIPARDDRAPHGRRGLISPSPEPTSAPSPPPG